MARGVTSSTHAAAIERQLVDAGPVDDERPFRAETRATSARRGAASESPTPRTWRVAPAGLVSGPSRLNDVRTPISRRVGPA